jgi:hypothetical protein
LIAKIDETSATRVSSKVEQTVSIHAKFKFPAVFLVQIQPFRAVKRAAQREIRRPPDGLSIVNDTLIPQ